MKPLLANKLDSLLKRFDNFCGGELRSIEVLSPTTMLVTLAGQDSAREYDWISLKLEFSGVSDAKLLQDNKLSLIDMSDGINIINSDNKFAFGIGKCYNISSMNNSICQITGSGLKYEEGLF